MTLIPSISHLSLCFIQIHLPHVKKFTGHISKFAYMHKTVYTSNVKTL